MAKKPVGASLRDRFPAGEKGDQELDQVIAVLYSRYLKSRGLSFRISPRGPGLWSGGETLCLHRRSPASLEAVSQQSAHAKELQTLVLAEPSSDPAPGAEEAIRDRLIKAGWERANRLQVLIWGPEILLNSLRQIEPLCLRHFPELVPDGRRRFKKILSTRAMYDREIIRLHSEIQFVGMSVYKEEASAGIAMEKIYIPLRVVSEGASEEGPGSVQTDPLTLLAPGARQVILGDPGSGKSTLLRFLALAGMKSQLLQRYGSRQDDRLPVLITLRRYTEELQARPNLSLLDYAIQSARTDLGLPSLDREFFESFLYAGQALIFLDGVDELPNPEAKTTLRERVADFLARYPGNTIVITSRIVGYDKEARFDGLQFSHHRVAKLSLENIEDFLNDWYSARIANRQERDVHAKDLVRILQDPDSRAIRELGENPLLLTIICLVHRIDAELPDERVVLYQKCTETLLNTWHNWKFRGERESLQSRNKVERRNRSRMEAIAYWMHASLKSGLEDVRRAVVSYDDLRTVLAAYIQETEKPLDESPLEMAETFLRFVRERAGLLIEVGNGQYSFVHLTFQEYLTATHLRKSGETAGVAVIWPFLEEHCGDPKWHEVIRLLVGSLERIESQKYLLERILPEQRGTNANAFERVMVAGGCLLDSGDAAEEMRDDILSALLFQAATAQRTDLLRRALRMLRSWEERGTANHGEVLRLGRAIAAKVRGSQQELGLGLSLTALGWSAQDVATVTTCLGDRSRRDGRIYFGLCGGKPSSTEWPESERNFAHSFLVNESFESSEQDVAAVSLTPLLFLQAAPSFSHLLACTGWFEGPYKHIFRTCLEIQNTQTGDLAGDRDPSRILDLDRILDRDRVRARAQAQARDLSRILGRDQGLIRSRSRDLSAALDRNLTRARSQSAAFWVLAMADENVCGAFAALVCALLALAPEPQWSETIRVRTLPQIPTRLTLAEPRVWESTIEAFRRHHADATDAEHAASQLLLDVWLWSEGHHDRPEQSPFRELAELTRFSDAPMLRIAHCIRDIAYGTKPRIADLKAMVESAEPAYRKIFEDAFWR
jgi:energy-coupling factor transporter ATP-binding protein EcfA2